MALDKNSNCEQLGTHPRWQSAIRSATAQPTPSTSVPANAQLKCEGCGTVFVKALPHQRYCSAECRQKEGENRRRNKRVSRVSLEELELYRADPLREKNQQQADFVICRECGEEHRSLAEHIIFRHFPQIASNMRVGSYLQTWNYPELSSVVTRGKNRQRKLEWARNGNVPFGGKRHVLKPGEGPTAVRRNAPTPAMLRARIVRSQKTAYKPRFYKRGQKFLGKDRQNTISVQSMAVDDATVVENRLAGDTAKDIAAKVGLTLGAVIARLKQVGLHRKHLSGKVFLHGQPVTKQCFLDVCDDFGVSKKTVVMTGMKHSFYRSAIRQLKALAPMDALPSTLAQCVLNARDYLTKRFCYARVAGKETRRLLKSEVRDLTVLRMSLRSPLLKLRDWLETFEDHIQSQDILNWICIQSREEVAGRIAGGNFRTLTILWPTLKELNAEKPGLLGSALSVDWKIDHLLSRDYGLAERQIRKAYRGEIGALDPGTLGHLITAELGNKRDSIAASRDKVLHKAKRGRRREDVKERTYFKIGAAVEKEIPSELKEDRHSIVAARRVISARTHLLFDVVAQYHKLYRKTLPKPV